LDAPAGRGSKGANRASIVKDRHARPFYEGESLLEIESVTKRYGGLVAVEALSAAIRPGEIFALLGPNGAGKTTLIGCATGLIQHFEGSIRVAGLDVRRDFRVARRLVGLVPQELNFDGFFTAREALFYQTGYFGERPERERLEALLRDFSLLDKADVNTRKLSGGMKRRLMICKALVHDPVLLFLDEPTAGVDVELREELWDYARRLRDRGATIVLTTHYLEEAERLADRIGVIDRGRLLRLQPREELLSELGRRWTRIVFDRPPPARLLERSGPFQLRREGERGLYLEGPDGVADSEGEGEGGAVDDLLADARRLGLRVRRVEGGRSTLEDVFKAIIGRNGANGEGAR